MGLDECADAVRDPILVLWDDRGVREWQSERMTEQGDHGVPVGERAGDPGFRERAQPLGGRKAVPQ